ncbi:1047_t:CDS:2, partial [Acaulospora morrowiae]
VMTLPKFLKESSTSNISPAWYNVHRRFMYRYDLLGGHDVDQNWIKDVRVKVDGKIRGKIVPRFQLHNWNQFDYQYLIQDPKEASSLTDTLATECRNRGFDGMVLEVGYTALLREFIKNLGNKLHEQSQELILVLAPKSSLTAAQYEDFSQFVDLFSLMTYDYSQPSAPGPNAPIEWVEDNIVALTPTSINRNKLLLGLNMYGTDFFNGQMEHVIGNAVIQKLKQHNPIIEWDKKFEEHHFRYQENGISHDVWYPSLKSIKSRLDLAEDYGTG